MIRLKDCPRCRGDMSFGEDTYGAFWTCLQCGFGRDVAAVPRKQLKTTARKAAVRENVA